MSRFQVGAELRIWHFTELYLRVCNVKEKGTDFIWAAEVELKITDVLKKKKKKKAHSVPQILAQSRWNFPFMLHA